MSLKHLPSITLPMGFAEHVLDLEMRLQEEQSLQLIQILSQMYRIGVEYYLDFDQKKAIYFQKKLNGLVVKAFDVKKRQNKKQKLSKAFKNQLSKYKQSQSTYVKSMMQKSQKNQKKLNEYVKADLDKQQQLFKHRMLKRVKSAGRLL